MSQKYVRKLLHSTDAFLINAKHQTKIDTTHQQTDNLYQAFCKDLFALSFIISEHFNHHLSQSIPNGYKGSKIGKINSPICLNNCIQENEAVFSKLTTQQKENMINFQQSQDINCGATKSLEKLLQNNSIQSEYSPIQDFQHLYSKQKQPAISKQKNIPQILKVLCKVINYQDQIDDIVQFIMNMPYDQYIELIQNNGSSTANKHFIENEQSTSSILNVRDNFEQIILCCKIVAKNIISQSADELDLGSHLHLSIDHDDHHRQSALTQLLNNSRILQECKHNQQNSTVAKTPYKRKQRKPLKMQLNCATSTKKRSKQKKVRQKQNCGQCSQKCAIF